MDLPLSLFLEETHIGASARDERKGALGFLAKRARDAHACCNAGPPVQQQHQQQQQQQQQVNLTAAGTAGPISAPSYIPTRVRRDKARARTFSRRTVSPPHAVSRNASQRCCVAPRRAMHVMPVNANYASAIRQGATQSRRLVSSPPPPPPPLTYSGDYSRLDYRSLGRGLRERSLSNETLAG